MAMNHKKRPYPGEKGSSSILLIIIMATLFSIGMLTAATTYSNYKIAEKNATWNSLYNELDGYYQSQIYDIASIKHKADSTVDEYFKNGDYMKPASKLIPQNVHRELAGYWSAKTNDLSGKELTGFLRSRLSIYLVMIEMGIESDFSSMLAKTDGELYESSKIKLKGREDSSSTRKLNAVVSIFGDEIKIVEYREVPGEFMYDDEVQFTDIEG
jgi:hypothetical protein